MNITITSIILNMVLALLAPGLAVGLRILRSKCRDLDLTKTILERQLQLTGKSLQEARIEFLIQGLAILQITDDRKNPRWLCDEARVRSMMESESGENGDAIGQVEALLRNFLFDYPPDGDPNKVNPGAEERMEKLRCSVRELGFLQIQDNEPEA